MGRKFRAVMCRYTNAITEAAARHLSSGTSGDRSLGQGVQRVIKNSQADRNKRKVS